MLERIKQKIKQNRFLFEELVKRDFTKKYKRTVLGMLWSILGPLMTLGVMALVFTQFFGRNMEHYVITCSAETCCSAISRNPPTAA